jgi:Asp-tRNA(Asn)/Glu-tRNA(Gln) amidotransferase C subunit
MTESKVIEIFECQTYRKKAWQLCTHEPWVEKDFLAPCIPRDEITLPNNEWKWVSDWIFERKTGVTGEDGWEYASRMKRFKVQGRNPRTCEARFSSARRRLWTRVMRRDVGIRSIDSPAAVLKIQSGLASIHTTRVRIEAIIYMKQAPSAAQSEQMTVLVGTVKRNIREVLCSLDQIGTLQQKSSLPQTTSSAVVKKLRNDVIKEENAIDKALGLKVGANGSKAGNGAYGDSKSGSTRVAESASSSSGAVKRGTAATFSSAVFSASAVDNVEDCDKGLFVDRTMRDTIIMQKFVPVDEDTVMQEIIDERDIEIKKVIRA